MMYLVEYREVTSKNGVIISAKKTLRGYTNMESVKESLMRFYATHKDYDTVEDIFVKYSAGFKKIQEGDPKETGLNFVFEDEIEL